MLIEFSVENYLSFRDKVTLSLVSGIGSELPANKFTAGNVELVRSAGIYGPNASGKSNLIEALRFVRGLVVDSARETQRGDTIAVKPFRLDPECTGKPSKFEVAFVARSDGKKYVYSFAADQKMVLAEELIRYDTHQPTRLFSRRWDGSHYQHSFSAKWRGGADAQELLKRTTRSNAFLLSFAARFNADDALPPFDWFERELQVVPDLRDKSTGGECTDRELYNPESRRWVMRLVEAADVGISDLEVTNMSHATIRDLAALAGIEMPSGLADPSDLQRAMTKRRFLHRTASGQEAWFEWESESAGTRQLYCLAGWLYDAAVNGCVLMIDEIEASLHPRLQDYLVRLINDPETNSANGQMVFTTHNALLMDNDLMRRDQLWFVEKNRDGASDLYSLWDFEDKPRSDSNYQTGYLHGRFGAVPVVGGMPGRKAVDGE